jgi:glutamate-ammonia-ligase adenylyltransferase
MLRIAWRDLSGLADLAVTLAELSALADACVQAALAWLYLESCTRWGKPTGDQPLIVLALGKLGAGELNFSSDIDLIYAYPEAGETDALRPLSHSEFFTKLGRSLTQALSAPEAEGFVYRVDLRLRPYGESGPPVLDFSALEDYYQTHARDWERYAMIKARAITGGAAGARLEAMLRPFVYRRYLDFGAIEALREMKALIEREYIRKGLHDNIKLGQGGIREIEFIAQMFQLMRGGRDPQLRQRGLQPVLAALAVAGYLPSAACAELTEGYCYLRRLENRLQMLRDQQTQTLPSDSLDRLRIALSMGHATWAACYAEWQQWQTRIHQHFTWILGQSSAAAEPVAVDRWRLLWQGRFGDVEAVNWLAGQGFAAPENVLQQLSSLRTSRQVRTLTAQGATRLDRLLPLWLAELALLPEPDTVLARVLPLLERIMQRTVYLALLSEQPAARTQLLRLAAASPWIVRLLTRQPLLLDELWDTRRLFALPSAAELNSALADRLAELAPDDVEAQMDTLRHFQQIQMLHTAAADVLGVLALPEVSDRLTLTAEVLIQAVLRLAWAHLVTRHGAPRYLAAGIQHPAPFIVVAYGKFGGHELGYGSDLDLVFLYDDTGERAQTAGGLENAVFFARLAQRILHLLTTVTPAGLLYPVDTRLRPDGRAGLVVSRLSAFAAYQRTQAWVWEHQALTRARVVAGDADLAAQFAELRAEVLSSPRDLAKLRVEVQQMRARMRAELAKANPGEFDLKQDAGGIADIEFMVQYSVLRWAGRYPELLQTTANRPLLAQLGKLGLWPVAWANAMRAAYVWLRVAVHRAALQEQAARGALDDFAELRSEVQAVWQALIETDTEENNDDSDNNGRP